MEFYKSEKEQKVMYEPVYELGESKAVFLRIERNVYMECWSKLVLVKFLFLILIPCHYFLAFYFLLLFLLHIMLLTLKGNSEMTIKLSAKCTNYCFRYDF